MDNTYIIAHLQKLAEVLNPNKSCFAYKKRNVFCFGCDHQFDTNEVTKQLAIYLIIGTSIYNEEEEKKKTKRKRMR